MFTKEIIPDALSHSEATSYRQTQIVRITDPYTPFKLESGQKLARVDVAFEQYGHINETRDNIILICHALTGSAHCANLPSEFFIDENIGAFSSRWIDLAEQSQGWWDALVGPGKIFNTDRYAVICSNFLGSCYGTTGPVSLDPETGKKYGVNFPEVTVRDMVRVQKVLLDRLGVKKIKLITGGSLGGMQVLEWALLYPDMVENIVPIATAAQHSAWAIGLNEVARQAIFTDPLWNKGRYNEQPAHGLATARMVAMLSYRSQPSFQKTQGRRTIQTANEIRGKHVFKQNDPTFQMENYLRYQGEKLVNRFDANTYITITHAMDSHDVTRGRADLAATLGSIKSNTICIGIDSDLLYLAHEQKEIASQIPSAQYREIKSPHGHDAFLIEFDQLDRILGDIIR